MRPLHSFCAVLAGALLSTSGAQAEGFYAGFEAARERLRFAPQYYTAAEVPDGRYINRARGTAGTLLAGHRWQLAADWSLAGEARLNFSDTRWRERLDEPAALRYDIPFSAELAVLPTWHAWPRVALFLDAGIALGRIRERKADSPFSTYDERRWRPGLVLGAGVQLRIADAWQLRLGYRETRYRALRYSSRDGAGDVVERIRDRPEQSRWYAGLTRSF